MSNRVVELLINLKTKGANEIENLIKGIRDLDGTANNSGRGVDSLSNSTKRADTNADQLGRTADQLDRNLKDVNSSTQRAGRGLLGFGRNAQRSQRLSQRLERTVGSLRGRFLGLAAAAAAAGAAFVTIRGIGRTADKFGLMSNAAQRARVSLEDLQAAEYAAGTIAGKTWEDMSKAFDTMGRRMSRFAETGGGPAAAALERIEGFDASKIVDMSSIQQLEILADAMKDMSEIERQDILFQLGGDNLKDLANGLKDSNDEFFELIKKAQEADWTLSSMEVDRLADLGGAIADISQTFQVLRERYLAQLAPALRVIADWFLTLSENAAGFGKDSQIMSRNVIRGIEWIITIYNRWMGIVKLQQAAMMSLLYLVVSGAGTVANAWDTAVNFVVNGSFSMLERGMRIAGRFSRRAKEAADELANYKPKQNNFSEFFEDMGAGMKEKAGDAWKEAQDYLTKEAPPLSAKLDAYFEREQAEAEAKKAKEDIQVVFDEDPVDVELQAKQADMIRGLQLELMRLTGREAEAQMIELKRKYADMLDELEGNSEGAALIEKLLDIHTAQAELDEFKAQLEELREAYELGDMSRAEYNRAVEDLVPKIDAVALRTGNEEVIESTKRMTQEYINLGDQAYEVGGIVGDRFLGLSDGLHEVIMGTKSLGDAFHEMAMGIVADLMKMIVQQMIFNALQSSFGGGAGGGFGGGVMNAIGLNHTGGYIGAGSARRSAPMSLFANATRYHTGGLIGADEVPIIAQRGEYMLDKYDIRNPKNGGDGSTPKEQGGSSQAVNITNVVDSASIAGAMDTPDGHNAIINVIKANAGTVKSVLR